MIPLAIHMIGDQAFKDTPDAKQGLLTDIAILEKGTMNGKPSVAVRASLDDGTVVILETTWALLYNAVLALRARYGEPV